MFPPSGTTAQYPVARLVGELFARAFTGALNLVQDGRRYALHFVDGHLVDEATEAGLVERARGLGVTLRVDRADHGADLVAAFTSAIEACGARLVVIGVKRRSPVGKLVMGSDAQRLLLELDAPVLAVKPAR